MNIIVTLNRNYIPPLTVMITSLLKNNCNAVINFYILHSSLRDEDFEYIKEQVPFSNYRLINMVVPRDFMAEAPVLFHYTKEMYYRIFAAELMPPEVDRAIYLDPDMVVINPLADLYQIEFGDKLFAAAKAPNPITQTTNKKRLNMEDETDYFNSGVLLMNIAELRKRDDHAAITDYIKKNADNLIMPDQDVLNAFYGKSTFILNPSIYNFDARYYRMASMLPPISQDESWIDNNTVIIHFCGKHKPWHKDYKGKLGCYYRQYRSLCGTEQTV